MRIQEIIKPAKSSRPKKRKAGEEELDVVGDSEVAKLREAMNAAAEEDLKANSERLPATSKLRLLPEVVETLRKWVYLFDALGEAYLLATELP